MCTPLITRRVEEQINLVINNVKLTFFQYPFEINKTEGLDDIILMPALIDLAAMKAYALGRRSKWKDYVDLYFIITKYFSVSVISKRATEIFEGLFSEKQFRAQLCFFEDIDYTEEVIYMGKEISQKEIRNTLTELAVQF